jgi:hypothetical protein
MKPSAFGIFSPRSKNRPKTNPLLTLNPYALDEGSDF